MRTSPPVLTILIVAGFVGCGDTTNHARDLGAAGARTAGTARGAEPARPAPANQGAAPGSIVVRAEPVIGGTDVAVVVEARAPASVRALRVERREGERFTPVAIRGLSLRGGCESAAETTCVSLREGGALHPPAWNGTEERGQCGCQGACRTVRPGEYRFVVEGCDGAHTFASDAFHYAP